MISTAPLWTLSDIAKALGLPTVGLPETPITGVSIDTRTLKPGDLFVALSGTPTGGFTSSFASTGDGHAYLRQAADKGAAAALVSTLNPQLTHLPQLVVNDTLMDGLWALGRAARARFLGQMVGLTGSAGKTSTKEMLATLLQAPASVGSYNNFWGVPLTLARIPAASPFAVVEMGMNQKGEIGRLSTLARPNVALVVNVHPVHIEHLGSLEAIRLEKLSIVEGLTPYGTLVLPKDVSLHDSGWHGPVLHFTGVVGQGADVYPLQVTPDGTDWHVRADVASDVVAFTLPDGAPHRLHNAMAALATVAALGQNPADIAPRFAHVGLMEGRGQAEDVGGVTIIDDSFNGNPASMLAALQSLAGRPVAGRRIAVLGDMLELGADAPRYHAELAAACAHLDGVIAVGPLMANLWNELPLAKRLAYCEAPEVFSPEKLAQSLRPGDAILLKGSKKMLFVHKAAPRLKAALQARS